MLLAIKVEHRGSSLGSSAMVLHRAPQDGLLIGSWDKRMPIAQTDQKNVKEASRGDISGGYQNALNKGDSIAEDVWDCQ
jgi:hypothetical protein